MKTKKIFTAVFMGLLAVMMSAALISCKKSKEAESSKYAPLAGKTWVLEVGGEALFNSDGTGVHTDINGKTENFKYEISRILKEDAYFEAYFKVKFEDGKILKSMKYGIDDDGEFIEGEYFISGRIKK
ncbi:MAG: hypothetical protein K6B17_09990 [Treponema sp.]|nr:hypothetical protein [Treponema sp.]